MRVLVVEPSDAIRARLVARLREAGLDVIGECSTAEAALRELVARPPDGVLIELELPDRPPLETVRLMRSLAPRARIIVLSNATHYQQRSLASGADHFLDKSTEFDLAAELLSSAR